MKPKIYPGCKLFLFDKATGCINEVHPDRVSVSFIDGKPQYVLKEPCEMDVMITQALNEKKAAAKFLTRIRKHNDDK